MNRGGRAEPPPPECALAAEMFDHFCAAGTMKQILALHREICNTLTLRPNKLPDFYPKLKAKLANSWKAQALFKKFDARANLKVYAKGRACASAKVLIIGAGPCGVRAAIECQLLGAKVVVIEKRDRMSRNNVLHLWPFVIQDLRALGAKKFFGKFCAGSIDHISIRQLQCILLKVALLLGVEFHEGVSFEELLEPTVTENSDTLGWRARITPHDHPVSQYEFDVLLGADGKRNTLHGFKRKEFRGKLAMAITANFINRHSEQEASVPEISGVAFIFNQKFFKELYEETGIDLENIVYYKDDTHYFVMTAKKPSLLEKGVLLHDYAEVSRLLSVENVDRLALMRYAQEAARFSTDGRLPLPDFALNHYGEPDVALFDFTSMYAAENASMVYERCGRRLLCQLVGDSLLEPFWPTGSGCARGFLSALDAAWAVRGWGQTPPRHPLEILAERESIYRLLAQTTPENLHRDISAYNVDPGSRYPNLNRNKVTPHQVTSFYDSDDPLPLDATPSARKRRRAEAEVSEATLVGWVACGDLTLREAAAPAALSTLLRRYRPDLLPRTAGPRTVYHVLHQEFGIVPPNTNGSLRDVPDAKLRSYLSRIYYAFKGEVPHVVHNTDVFDQIKQNLQKEKNHRNTTDHNISSYSNAADIDKSHSSNRKKRRSLRPQQVSNHDHLPQIGKLHLDDIKQFAKLMDGQSGARDLEIQRDKEKMLAFFEKSKKFTRSSSIDTPLIKGKRLSEILGEKGSSQEFQVQRRLSDTPKPAANTKKIATLLFEDYKRRHVAAPEMRRSNSVSNLPVSVRKQRMAEIIEGKRKCSPSPVRKPTESIGLADMAMRRQKVEDLIQGPKRRYEFERRNSDVASRMQRVTDMMKKVDVRKGKSGGRRKAAREIMRQRYEKSVQMLAAEPILATLSTDLEHDVGLQQYRASAPHFNDRVKSLEKQLQHYEEGRIVGLGSRTAGGGARVARLAAELSGTNTNNNSPKSSKPKDLMRSVGKIERDDWNVKEIERKIMENRLGRPEPKTAEKVPKWDREQFLGRQRRLKEGEQSEEKWGEIDETLHKLDQKLRDSGRPDHGTKKVASLATKFVKKEESPVKSQQLKEEKKSWRGPSSAGVQCAACGTRVFAAEGVIADGLHLHRACFRCAVCKAVLRPGNYTMERNGCRLVCLRHSGISVPDALQVGGPSTLAPTPERISIELSDSGQREIDEDEWTDRNFLASETSGAGGLSDEDESSSDEYTDAGDSDLEAEHCAQPAEDAKPARDSLYFSDDSFGYDDLSDDGAESSGNESCPRMREAREARRREVPADARPPTDSSEVESEEESDSSEEMSSATEVSTDSEFAREESAPISTPPAILVTEAPPPQPVMDYPLSRTRSAGGLATKRALELKRRYLLGDPSPQAVRKSDSTSQLDTKLEAFRSNITEFQKMLHPAPLPNLQKPVVTFQFAEEKKAQPMPDIIKNLCDAPVDLLTKGETLILKKDYLGNYPTTVKESSKEEESQKLPEKELDSDSLSEDDSSHTETIPNKSVPRVEVHNEGGELIQLDSLTLVTSSTEDNDEKASGTATMSAPTVIAAESESSESCRDVTTLAMTETELSDWAADSAVLDDYNSDDKDKNRKKPPRTLSGPKTIHDAKNLSAISSHVCGRSSPPEAVVYSNALEHFEFVDEGDQDPSIETPVTPKNEGYMELVDDEYDPYSPGNDRSMNFIERNFSETVVMPSRSVYDQDRYKSLTDARNERPLTLPDLKTNKDDPSVIVFQPKLSPKATDEVLKTPQPQELKCPQILMSIDSASGKSSSEDKSEAVIQKVDDIMASDVKEIVTLDNSAPLDSLEPIESLSTVDELPKLNISPHIEDTSPPLVPPTPKSSSSNYNISLMFPSPCSIRLYSPAICRSASETFNRSSSRSTDSPSRSIELNIALNLSSGSLSPVSPTPTTTDKVQEIKREREEQTEVVRRLVLERLGNAPRVTRKSTRRSRISPVCNIPPPVPPPPVLPTPPTPPPPPKIPDIPPPPPRPAPPLTSLPNTPSFSDPELARERLRMSFMKSISHYFNRRLGPRQKEPTLSSRNAHKSTGALQEAPPVPPPPVRYSPPSETKPAPARVPAACTSDADERDAMQLWFEARWARLVKQRRAREDSSEPHSRRLARLERKLTRPLSAEQQAATVAELVQVSAQRRAHQALMAADRRRNGED